MLSYSETVLRTLRATNEDENLKKLDGVKVKDGP